MKRVKRGVTSEASCTSSFSWMQNSLKQDPCLVAAYLQSECASGSECRSARIVPTISIYGLILGWDIQALANDSHYTTPNSDATACQWYVTVYYHTKLNLRVHLFTVHGLCTTQYRLVRSANQQAAKLPL